MDRRLLHRFAPLELGPAPEGDAQAEHVGKQAHQRWVESAELRPRCCGQVHDIRFKAPEANRFQIHPDCARARDEDVAHVRVTMERPPRASGFAQFGVIKDGGSAFMSASAE